MMAQVDFSLFAARLRSFPDTDADWLGRCRRWLRRLVVSLWDPSWRTESPACFSVDDRTKRLPSNSNRVDRTSNNPLRRRVRFKPKVRTSPINSWAGN